MEVYNIPTEMHEEDNLRAAVALNIRIPEELWEDTAVRLLGDSSIDEELGFAVFSATLSPKQLEEIRADEPNEISFIEFYHPESELQTLEELIRRRE